MNGHPRDLGLRVASTLVAVVVNGGLFAGMALAGILEPKAPEPPGEIIELELLEITQKGEIRDPKLLPRIPTSPAPLPPEEPVVKTGPAEEPKPPAPDEMKLRREREEKERQQKEAEERKLREEEKKKRQAAIDRALDRIGDEDSPPEGHPEGSEHGNTTDPTKLRAFENSLGLALREQFLVPATIPQSELRLLSCELGFEIGADGKVKGEPRIKRGSGNRFFDDAALRAVRSFQPGTPHKLPLPPDPAFRKRVTSNPIAVTMHGSDLN